MSGSAARLCCCACPSFPACTTCTGEGTDTPNGYKIVLSSVASVCCVLTGSVSIIPADINGYYEVAHRAASTGLCGWGVALGPLDPTLPLGTQIYNDATCSSACTLYTGSGNGCTDTDTFLVKLVKDTDGSYYLTAVIIAKKFIGATTFIYQSLVFAGRSAVITGCMSSFTITNGTYTDPLIGAVCGGSGGVASISPCIPP